MVESVKLIISQSTVGPRTNASRGRSIEINLSGLDLRDRGHDHHRRSGPGRCTAQDRRKEFVHERVGGRAGGEEG